LTFKISADKFFTYFIITNKIFDARTMACGRYRQRRLVLKGTDVFLRLWPLKLKRFGFNNRPIFNYPTEGEQT